jgi:hypothetical protein
MKFKQWLIFQESHIYCPHPLFIIFHTVADPATQLRPIAYLHREHKAWSLGPIFLSTLNYEKADNFFFRDLFLKNIQHFNFKVDNKMYMLEVP